MILTFEHGLDSVKVHQVKIAENMQTTKTKHKPTETCKNGSRVSVHADVHNLVCRTAQNIFDNLPDLPPDNHYYSGVVQAGGHNVFQCLTTTRKHTSQPDIVQEIAKNAGTENWKNCITKTKPNSQCSRTFRLSLSVMPQKNSRTKYLYFIRYLLIFRRTHD